MRRRGFFGLLGKLLAVGVSISMAPEILKPLKAVVLRGAPLYYDRVGRTFYQWDGGQWNVLHTL